MIVYQRVGRMMKFSTSEIIFDPYLGLSPFSVIVANEGLAWDPLLKYNNPWWLLLRRGATQSISLISLSKNVRKPLIFWKAAVYLLNRPSNQVFFCNIKRLIEKNVWWNCNMPGLVSWEPKGTPPMPPPTPRNKASLRDYNPLVSLRLPW